MVKNTEEYWREEYYLADSSRDKCVVWGLITTLLLFIVVVFCAGELSGDSGDIVDVEAFGMAICQENGQEYDYRDYVRRNVDDDIHIEKILRVHCVNVDDDTNNLSTKLIQLEE